MSITINGWASVDFVTVNLTAGANASVPSAGYLVVVPAANGDSITSFADPPDTTLAWTMLVANGDPTGTMTITIPGVIFPPGKSTLTLPPGAWQQVVYGPGYGWVVLAPAVLA